MNLRSGELKFDLTAEDVPVADLLSEPLQALNLKSDLRSMSLGSMSTPWRFGEGCPLSAHLEGGRLTTEQDPNCLFREGTGQAVAGA